MSKELVTKRSKRNLCKACTLSFQDTLYILIFTARQALSRPRYHYTPTVAFLMAAPCCILRPVNQVRKCVNGFV